VLGGYGASTSRDFERFEGIAAEPILVTFLDFVTKWRIAHNPVKTPSGFT
jgi:hypothetical protein